jgi:4-amino-4-deoxy-L-arabinose transferase-like glycosyltransferase
MENAHRQLNSLILILLAIIYISVRLLAWNNSVVVEDHDSISLLLRIRSIINHGFNQIVNWNADATPFYPVIGALCSLPGWSEETGARLGSLIFSLILFIAFVGFNRQFTDNRSLIFGLIFLCLNPVLIYLSISILTEPSYISLVFVGICLFLTQYKNPSVFKGILLGFIFGLAFLNRTEGILYLLILPFMQGLHAILDSTKQYKFKNFCNWTVAFSLTFLAMAVPQIWNVSHKMGKIAINGRQAWMTILSSSVGKSYEEKIYGLDYSKKQINLRYLQGHPKALNELSNREKSTKYFQYIKRITKNILYFFQEKVPILIGPFGILFFGLGVLSILNSGQNFEIIFILIFLFTCLIGPLMHNVVVRHIAIITPIMLLIQGVGVSYLYNQLKQQFENYNHAKYLILVVLFIHFIAGTVIPLAKKIEDREYINSEYSISILKEPVRIINELKSNKLSKPVTIVARKTYLAYYADANYFHAPYTTYNKFVKYCQLNDVDFIFLQHKLLKKYPFLNSFTEGKIADDFRLIHAETDLKGNKIELYRVIKN